MRKFVHITDTHFTSSSNVRAGDLFKDQIDKLRWVVAYANANNADLLHSGDFFDKPSVPDFVKTGVIEALKPLKGKCYVIWGNHDTLYGSTERNYRTSLQVLAEAGVVVPVKERIDLGECILSNERPIQTAEKPMIVLFHGFLNALDGDNCIQFHELVADSKVLLLLGHEHVKYEPCEYKNIIIYRPGSFTRAIRNDSADRIPECLLIKADSTGFEVIERPIEMAKQVELLFKDKQSKVVKSEISYQDIIEQIKNASKEKDNLTEALRMVTDDSTVLYINNAIEEYNQKYSK